jgi:hypothetical protein
MYDNQFEWNCNYLRADAEPSLQFREKHKLTIIVRPRFCHRPNPHAIRGEDRKPV